jgi:hypothetical protein
VKKLIVIIMMLTVTLMVNAGVLEETKEYKKAINDPAARHLARPSATQYKYHEQERIMFVCLDPCT